MDDTALSTSSALLARFRRRRGDEISEQDVILVPSEAASMLEGCRDMDGWCRLELPVRPGIVPLPLTLFLSPLLWLAMAGDPVGDDDVIEDAPPPVASMANARIRPQRWPRGLPCPGGLDDDD